MTKAFISYSWESENHKNWVRDLATRLRCDGIDVKLDQWHLAPGDQLTEFMELAVRESDYVLIICTPRYKNRSDNRKGGVGYEGDIMTSEVFTSHNNRKFIPILRHSSWEEAAPSWLLGKYYVDLSSSPYGENNYSDLLTTLLGTRPVAPSVLKPNQIEVQQTGDKGTHTDTLVKGFEHIRIIGIVVDKVGTPLNDGSKGSGLYKVPFRLSRRPSEEWSNLFIQYWNHPPKFTTMHRPGIASIVGDTVVLDGTTVDEVEKYHRDTLILVIKETNSMYSEFKAQERLAEERSRIQIEEHKRNVGNAASRIKFDEE